MKFLLCNVTRNRDGFENQYALEVYNGINCDDDHKNLFHVEDNNYDEVNAKLPQADVLLIFAHGKRGGVGQLDWIDLFPPSAPGTAGYHEPKAFNNYYLFPQYFVSVDNLFLIILCVCEGFSPDAMAGLLWDFPTAIGLIGSLDAIGYEEQDALIALLNMLNERYRSIDMVDQYFEKIVADWKNANPKANRFHPTRPMVARDYDESEENE